MESVQEVSQRHQVLPVPAAGPGRPSTREAVPSNGQSPGPHQQEGQEEDG